MCRFNLLSAERENLCMISLISTECTMKKMAKGSRIPCDWDLLVLGRKREEGGEGGRKGGSPLSAFPSQRFCSLKLQAMISPERQRPQVGIRRRHLLMHWLLPVTRERRRPRER